MITRWLIGTFLFGYAFFCCAENPSGEVKSVTGFRMLEVQTEQDTINILLHGLKFSPPQSEVSKQAERFIREKCLSQKIDVSVDFIKGKLIYGDVTFTDGTSCTKIMLQQGLCDYDPEVLSLHPDYEDIVWQAKSSKIGMWSDANNSDETKTPEPQIYEANTETTDADLAQNCDSTVQIAVKKMNELISKINQESSQVIEAGKTLPPQIALNALKNLQIAQRKALEDLIRTSAINLNNVEKKMRKNARLDIWENWKQDVTLSVVICIEILLLDTVIRMRADGLVENDLTESDQKQVASDALLAGSQRGSVAFKHLISLINLGSDNANIEEKLNNLSTHLNSKSSIKYIDDMKEVLGKEALESLRIANRYYAEYANLGNID